MTFAQSWLRQAFGAVGATLIAPLAVFVAAGALALGGGLGGLGELGQITSGPSLPGGELVTEAPGIETADIVGADVGGAAAAGGGAGATSSPAGPGAPGAVDAGPVGSTPLPSPLTDVPSGPVGGGNVVEQRPVNPPGQSPAPPSGGPGESIGAPARGVQMVVPEPLQPVTQNLIDLLLGPPPE